MGGKILEYEAKTILRQGEQKGRQLGRLENLVQNIKGLMKTMGWSAEQACRFLRRTAPLSPRGYNFAVY